MKKSKPYDTHDITPDLDRLLDHLATESGWECPECSTRIDVDDNVCPKCGYKLSEIDPDV